MSNAAWDIVITMVSTAIQKTLYLLMRVHLIGGQACVYVLGLSRVEKLSENGSLSEERGMYFACYSVASDLIEL